MPGVLVQFSHRTARFTSFLFLTPVHTHGCLAFAAVPAVPLSQRVSHPPSKATGSAAHPRKHDAAAFCGSSLERRGVEAGPEATKQRPTTTSDWDDVVHQLRFLTCRALQLCGQ